MTHWLEKIAPRPRAGSTHRGLVRYSGANKAEAEYLEPLRMIYDHELIVYEGSTFAVEFEGGQGIRCVPGSFIVIPPGRLHVERNIGGHPGRRHWCHFDWDYQPDYNRTPVVTFAPGKADYHLCRPAPEYVPPCPLNGQTPNLGSTRERMQRITSLVTGDTETGRLEARVVLLQVLIALLSSTSTPATMGNTRAGLASRIRRQLDRAAHQDTLHASLPDTLKDLNHSYEHMCRVFRATYGLTPLHYVQAVQIARAQILLRSTSLDIAEISYRVGFGGAAYFSKVFRSQTGSTPSEYRATSSLEAT